MYDAAGNLTKDSDRRYFYDCANKLTRIESGPTGKLLFEARYDAFGRRVEANAVDYTWNGSADAAQDNKTRFYYDGFRVIEDRDSSGTVLTHSIWGDYLDECLLFDKSPTSSGTSAARYYALRSDQYSTHALVNESGAIAERYRFSAYGTPEIVGALPQANSSVGFPWLYTGQRFDFVTGLHHYKARAYSSHLGRFLTRDPLGYIDGMSMYEYVKGRPGVMVDPWGYESWLSRQISRASKIAVPGVESVAGYIYGAPPPPPKWTQQGAIDAYKKNYVQNKAIPEAERQKAKRLLGYAESRDKFCIKATRGWFDSYNWDNDALILPTHWRFSSVTNWAILFSARDTNDDAAKNLHDALMSRFGTTAGDTAVGAKNIINSSVDEGLRQYEEITKPVSERRSGKSRDDIRRESLAAEAASYVQNETRDELVSEAVGAGGAYLGAKLLEAGIDLLRSRRSATTVSPTVKVCQNPENFAEYLDGPPSKRNVVNLGGEGEVQGVLNVQGPWALHENWRTSQKGETLQQLTDQGHVVIIADNRKLPFADNSVDEVITNNVPIDKNTWLGPGVQTSEIMRILKPGGR